MFKNKIENISIKTYVSQNLNEYYNKLVGFVT